MWSIYFFRGISYERAGNWILAEADFRKALELNPKQPQVLNYLGYSLIERREQLNEALSMIEMALQVNPDSGHIVDSYAWCLYRLGDYKKAAKYMEKAVELEPSDPIVNDHLGDALWMIGRRREAVFQWKRAIVFKPEKENLARIEKKIELGLDKVLLIELNNEK